MKTYHCPEFAATGLELQIIELQAQRETAIEHGWLDEARSHDAQIAELWAQLADLAEHYTELADTPTTHAA